MSDLLQVFSADWPVISDESERNEIAVHLSALLSSRKPLLNQKMLVCRQQIMPELERSLCDYGITNLQALRNSQHLFDYCRDIEKLICKFEPRIADAVVNILPGKTQDNTLQLQIRITLADARRQLNLETRIRLDTGACQLREAGRD